MSVFDPNDWWEGGSWFRSTDRDRRPEEINREVVTRWLASVALCLCFAALWPSEHLAASFAVLLILAGIASAGLAILRQDPLQGPHLTPWDEALWSLLAGLVLWLWCVPPGFGQP
jgi:hypothetical protein